MENETTRFFDEMTDDKWNNEFYPSLKFKNIKHTEVRELLCGATIEWADPGVTGMSMAELNTMLGLMLFIKTRDGKRQVVDINLLEPGWAEVDKCELEVRVADYEVSL